jgi:hypothetical protein
VAHQLGGGEGLAVLSGRFHVFFWVLNLSTHDKDKFLSPRQHLKENFFPVETA